VAPTPVQSRTSSPSTADGFADDAAYARVPSAARAHTLPGAQAFAEFYTGQVNKAWTIPDPGQLTGYSTKSCSSCDNLIGNARWLLEKGRRYQGPAATISAAAYLPESTIERPRVSVIGKRTGAAIIDSSGRVVGRGESGPYDLSFDMVWMGGRWAVTSIKLVVVSK